jgi:hypothetical protein
MLQIKSFRWAVTAAAFGAGLFAWPAPGDAQTVVGNAKAARVTAYSLLGGSTTALADTGALGGTSDARDAALVTASIPSVLSGEVLRAVTIGWPDQVTSEASLAGLGLTVGGIPISADFVMATATALLGGTVSGRSILENLSINGVPVAVSGEPNQTFVIPGGEVVVNQQTVSAAGTTVNALRATVFGVTDVVVASATAGIR